MRSDRLRKLSWRKPEDFRTIAVTLRNDGLTAEGDLYAKAADDMDKRYGPLRSLVTLVSTVVYNAKQPPPSSEEVWAKAIPIAEFLRAQGWTPPESLTDPACEEDND